MTKFTEVKLEELIQEKSLQKIFAYGTLQDISIQHGVVGKRLPLVGRDRLPGFRHKYDPYPVGIPMIVQSGNQEDSIVGTVYECTEDDISNMDRYEGSAYHRIKTTTEGGREVWVYVGNN
jgi:gamma-glutamylcyclotransferase (GGCT)/AIG2-like uncharacterized protein YtfP